MADKLGGNKQRSAREIAKKCSGVLSLRFVLHAVQKHQCTLNYFADSIVGNS